MMITLKDISDTTLEKLLNAALPLLTGFKYTSKVIDKRFRNDDRQIKIVLEITESPQSPVDLDNLKNVLKDLIDEENFVKRYQAEKNR